MFAKTIIDSDAFLDMPQSSQLLYFHLSMRADDEGFINNPKAIMRNVGCKEDDIKLLIAKKFIIPFESGVVVIKHWKIHNYIQKDRFTPTKYQEERASLELDENKSYTQCIQAGYNLDTQVRIGKDRLGKERKEIGEDREEQEKKETYVSVLDSYTSDPSLRSALDDYVEMRKKTKGFTVAALRLNLNNLDKLTTNLDEKVEIVNKSVERSWKGLFPLKPDERKALRDRKAPTPTYSEPEETPTGRIISSYKSELGMLQLFPGDEEIKNRLENYKAMYRDLTGQEIEESEDIK